MPRTARERSPSDYYHVMMRGVNREPIFGKGHDKLYFLNTIKEEERLAVAAYCIMDNHAHLVVRCGFEEMPRALGSVNVKYAMHYNVINERVGHVFQNRYKSEIVEDYPYMISVIRYVHNNPVKAQMTSTASAYGWSSYNEYLHGHRVVSETEKSFVLELFDNNIYKFEDFHVGKDEVEYLEMQEEIERWRLERAQETVEKYRRQHGPANLRRLVESLLRDGTFAHRQIAGLVGVSASFVHQISVQSRTVAHLADGS